MATSPTGRKLLEVTARIFGQHIGNGLPSGRKILARALAGPKVLQWYPEPYGKHDPLFEDPYRKYDRQTIPTRMKICISLEYTQSEKYPSLSTCSILDYKSKIENIKNSCIKRKNSWKMKLEKAKRKGKGPPPKGGGKRGKK